MGPNVKRLIAHKMATDAIPAQGGLADGLRFLSSAESIRNGCRAATAWVHIRPTRIRRPVPTLREFLPVRLLALTIESPPARLQVVLPHSFLRSFSSGTPNA